MLNALKGVVLSLVLFGTLNIGTTPVEARSALKQKHFSAFADTTVCLNTNSPLCLEHSEKCSEGVSYTNRDSKLIASTPRINTVSLLANPTTALDAKVISINPHVEEVISTVEPKIEPMHDSYVAVATAPASITATPNEIAEPTVTATQSAGLNSETLFSMVNTKRAEAGLAPFQKHSSVCDVAAARAPELQGEVATGALHAGFWARKPAYQATENMIYMQNEEQALNWWLNSPIHRSAIYGNYQYSCVICTGNTCAQIFANIPENTPTVSPSPVVLSLN